MLMPRVDKAMRPVKSWELELAHTPQETRNYEMLHHGVKGRTLKIVQSQKQGARKLTCTLEE